MTDHYFSARPGAAHRPGLVRVVLPEPLAGRPLVDGAVYDEALHETIAGRSEDPDAR